jgi:hypothetical protein
VVTALLVSGLAAPRAVAHPSALDALTLDLLLDRGGLVLVDGAANGDSYDLTPHPEARTAMAIAVLDALGAPRDSVEIDATKSLLYHEVGFSIWLHEAFANGTYPGELRIDTRRLQDIARSTVGALHLDVCRVDWPDQSLIVEANVPASPPDREGAGSASSERRDCAAWTLRPDDAPVTIIARVPHVARGRTVPHSVRLSCGHPSDIDPTYRQAGPIALRPQPMHARATGDTGAKRLVAEAFVFARNHTDTDLLVPLRLRHHVLVGTRGGTRASRRMKLPRCSALGREWLVYPIDFWVDTPRCVPIIVRTEKTSRVVRVGVGAPCARGSDGGDG